MRVVFETMSDDWLQKKVWLRSGDHLKVGRTDWSDFAVPHDHEMSPVHFEIRCDAASCELHDLESSSGTSVNGRRIKSAALQHGDSIIAGRTEFRVSIERISQEPVAPSPAKKPEIPPIETEPHVIKCWRWRELPEQWEPMGETALRWKVSTDSQTLVTACQLDLPGGMPFSTFVEMWAGPPNENCCDVTPIEIRDADEAAEVIVRPTEGELGSLPAHRHIFARREQQLGMLTVTAQHDVFDDAILAFDQALPMLSLAME